MLESLSDKGADFSYSLQILLKMKLNTGFSHQASFLRTPSANAPVKCFPFRVRVNAGKKFCHIKS